MLFLLAGGREVQRAGGGGLAALKAHLASAVLTAFRCCVGVYGL